ncbi:hypothetical protein IAT38_007787 [Cryptococcus sp. DSM 104549]
MAAVTSPVSASPGVSLLEWDEAAVVSFLAHLEMGEYEDAIHEHGITGDVLSALDHETLQDMGMTSIGHRLVLLRSVWELKRDQGIELGDDDWRPQEVEEFSKQAESDRLLDLINEQHERLMLIERDHVRLLSALEENGIVVPLENGPDWDVASEGNRTGGLGRSGSLRRERSEEPEDDELRTTKATQTSSSAFPSSLASSNNTSVNAPSSSKSATFQDSYTPTTSNGPYPFDSPSTNGDKSTTSKPQQAPPLTRLISGSSIMNAAAAASSSPGITPPAGSAGTSQSQSQSQSQSLSASSSKPSSSLAPTSSSTPTPGPSSSAPTPGPSSTPVQTSGPSERERSRAKDAAHSAAKSFRVTLEDPCWKVLPAALKKYKINDDWKLYALFICFDNTERCLSYDEKPLLLFQKLKETGHKPVFMLRHIKDIKSPVHVAHTKQAQRLGLPLNTPNEILPSLRPTSDTSVSPTKATLQPAIPRGEDGQTPNGAAFPELPSPGLRDGEGSAGIGGSSRGATGLGTMVDEDGNVIPVTYGVAIYPYCADREDEFDVAVGSTYVIRSKSKGWYIVNKDPEAMGMPKSYDQGWVPAGCLLELNQPMSIVSPTTNGELAAYPGLSPLPPSAITSSSYAGFVLMDYEAKADVELNLFEGEKVRVYKKYCHWSYCIKDETGERGWVPAWFVGKTANTISVGMKESQAAAAAKAAASGSGSGSAGSSTGSGSGSNAAAPIAAASAAAGTGPTVPGSGTAAGAGTAALTGSGPGSASATSSATITPASKAENGEGEAEQEAEG